MSYKGKQVLAVIPARGGSKGIPRKNLVILLGLSLIARAAETAKAIGYIDKVIISTNDREMAKEAVNHGAEAPFLRPAEISTDLSTAIDTWKHAWLFSEEYYGHKFDISVLLEPTSPMRKPEDIQKTIELLLSGNYDTAVTVSKTPAHFSPHKALYIDNNNHLKTFHLEGEKYSIRQKIPSFYHKNGIAYVAKRKTIIEDGTILGGKCAAFMIERHTVNIDTPHDLELAEFLLKKQNDQIPHLNI